MHKRLGLPLVPLRLTYILAVIGLALSFLLLTHHAPRRVVEATMTVPALLLVIGGASLAAFEKQLLSPPPLAPLVAIVGCDGAGKSTLSADLLTTLRDDRSVELCYLGLGSGELGNRIKEWPLIGPLIERTLAQKAGQARDKSRTIPGLPTALVIFAFSLLRLRRFRRMLALRRQGVTVLADRYPQTEVAGFYDGPGLSAAHAGSRPVAWLARRERRMYEQMAGFRPDLVLRLNIDADTALARKPDHKPDLLREKVRVTPLLHFHGARIVDLDARGLYSDVRREALDRVRTILNRVDRLAARAR